ncbi:helix-turn-helix domain-containing protein [Proteiniborus sp. MB09-C3]|uniref:helix-turn-helix domain-containing protein n=1 Tax=Proteiniborus sp. MB09-C3 TaxID=3050072 RepID=UPI002552D7C3|nr:helix-turn-helix domain-containing protein [Proteiniborus sp. MB09-C3]WIV11936.1 helix-turn-helix domain-containing protein [Proteiniborus sp. MB09-C3]
MSKYNKKDKIKAIRLIQNENYSIRAVSKELGISKSTIARWWNSYDIHGEASFSMNPRKYTGEFKIEVVKYMHNNHLSLDQVSALFGIPGTTTVQNWERIYNEEGEVGLLTERRGRSQKQGMKKDKNEINMDSLDKATEDKLILEIKKLKAEVAYLKKSIALKEEKMSLKTKKKHR